MIKSFLVFIGFLTVTLANYLIYSYVSYGLTLGFWRIFGILLAVMFYFLAIRDNSYIKKAANYLQQQNLQRKGKYLFAFFLGIIHIVLTVELTSFINNQLIAGDQLNCNGQIVNCEKSYCICEYSVYGKTYQQKFNNKKFGFNPNDVIQLQYYPNNPNIYKITGANNR